MNFLEVLLNFPTEEQVRKFCKPGRWRETCSYLATGGHRLWECVKFAGSKYENKQIFRGPSTSSNDNCPGILGFLADNQDRLKGRTVEYGGSQNVFEAIEMDDDTLHIFWSGGENGVSYGLKDLYIAVDRWKVVFGIKGLGDIGSTIVFLSW